MSNRTLTFLLAVVIVGMCALILLNMTGLYWNVPSEKFLSHNNVKGMDIVHSEKHYPLNFKQQNQVINILNRSVKIGHEAYFEGEEGDIEWDHLTIYQFEGPTLEVKPVAFLDRQLLFRVAQWNPEGLLRETGPGNLHPLLSQTYDP